MRGDGPDVLYGGAATDAAGADGAGDDLGGDAGSDVVGYEVEAQDAPVSVSLDGEPNDGPPGEGDSVRPDVETVRIDADRGGNTLIGSPGRDVLIMRGTGRADTIVGGDGRDELFGQARMLGGSGADIVEGQGTLFGGGGNDRITAMGPGRFDGGPGDDLLTKAVTYSGHEYPGPAHLRGGTGNDKIDATDAFCDLDENDECTLSPLPGADTVACGPGRDTARLGARDTARRDCERITAK